MNIRLKKLRKSINLSQAELAQMIGVSERQYRKIENEQTMTSVATALKIAKILGTSVESLFTSANPFGEER